MRAYWIVLIGDAGIGAWIIYQTLFGAQVSTSSMFLRLIALAAKAVLVMAVGRPHPKVTDSDHTI